MGGNKLPELNFYTTQRKAAIGQGMNNSRNRQNKNDMKTTRPYRAERGDSMATCRRTLGKWRP